MRERLTSRFLVAAPECAKGKFEEILSAIRFEPDAVCKSGEETIREAEGAHVLLLTAWKLEDMTGAELAKRLGDSADVLMIVPGDYDEDEAEDCGALLLRNPLSQDALAQAIRATMHMQKKLLAWKAKAEKSERVLEDRKVIDRAKGRLMDQLHMSEKQAHYYIQKKSMDLGKRIADVAREILEAEKLEAGA